MVLNSLVLLRNGSDAMIHKRYRFPLGIAIVINLCGWAIVGNWAQYLQDFHGQDKELIVTLDMNQFEMPESQIVSQMQENRNTTGRASSTVPTSNTGGKAGSPLPDLSGKPMPGLKDLNPYLGGNERATVNVKGNTDGPVGIPGFGNIPGEGGGAQGSGGLGNEGDGSSHGAPGIDPPGGGYSDSSSYIARVEANKVMPQQAIRRGLTGTVSFSVTFDTQGDFESAVMTSSSGSSILDNAASALVSSQGGIENTTGKSVTIVVNVSYDLY